MENFIVMKKKELWTVSKNGIIWGVFADQQEAEDFTAKYEKTNPSAQVWRIYGDK